MKDDPNDPDSPIWTPEDFARAVPAADMLPAHLAGLLLRRPSTSLRVGFARQPVLARRDRLAA